VAGKGKPGPPSREQAAQRRVEIWELRVQGHTQAEIGRQYGITQQRVAEILDEAYKERVDPAAERARAEARDRYDNLRKAAMGIIRRYETHDDPTVLAAMDRVLKVDAREASLFGLDAPVKQEVTSYAYTVNGVDPEALK
jgi:hypothetical protein